MYRVDLIVRPKPGVRDPQGEAVGEALGGVGYKGVRVHHVGRTLRMDLDVANESEAKRIADDMCKRLLVNPNLEVYELSVVRA